MKLTKRSVVYASGALAALAALGIGSCSGHRNPTIPVYSSPSYPLRQQTSEQEETSIDKIVRFDGNPLPGARVELVPLPVISKYGGYKRLDRVEEGTIETIADEKGRIRIDNLESGEYELTVEHRDLIYYGKLQTSSDRDHIDVSYGRISPPDAEGEGAYNAFSDPNTVAGSWRDKGY